MHNKKMLLILPLLITLSLVAQTSFTDFAPLPESRNRQDSSAKTPEEYAAAAEYHRKAAEYHQGMVAQYELLSAEHAKLGLDHQEMAKNFAAIAKIPANQATKDAVTEFSSEMQQLSKHY